jgi:hypothetical protein
MLTGDLFLDTLIVLMVILTFLSVVVTVKVLLKRLKEEENKPYYLYLDDERNIPVHYGREHNWVVRRSSKEAIDYVTKCGLPQFMSLDHDLGGDDTTMNFLKWLAYEYWPQLPPETKIPAYVVHSANPVGRQNIISFMESWKKSQGL